MLPERFENREFTKVGFNKGYAIAEVDEYIDLLIEAYEELAAELHELEGRYEQLDAAHEECKSKVDGAQEVLDRGRTIIAEAEAQAQAKLAFAKTTAEAIETEANEKAKALRISSENTAKKLLTEIKARTESINEENQKRKEASEKEAEEIIYSAKDQAKKHTEKTNAQCAEKIAECEAEIKRRFDEFEVTAKKAADFRAKLFEAYSEQILSLENIVIPEEFHAGGKELTEVQTPDENVITEPPADIIDLLDADDIIVEEDLFDEDGYIFAEPEEGEAVLTSDTADVPQEQAEEDPDTESSPESETVEVSDITFDEMPKASADTVGQSANIIEDTDPMAFEAPAEQSKASKGAENIYAGFDVETEHSGQVHYDTNDIASVNKKLDDIMKNKDDSMKNNLGVSQKLGFLK